MKKKDLKIELRKCELDNVKLQRQVLRLVEIVKELRILVDDARELNTSYKTLLAAITRMKLSKLSDDELLEVIL